MHVRRRFLAAHKLGDKRAARGIELVGALYEIERIAKEAGASAEQRLELRTGFSSPLLDAFKAWVDERSPRTLPRSPFEEALGYARQQRAYVRRCFTDGEIDNGLAERILREPCSGRKAYLSTGSAQAARRLAGAYSLVQSCRQPASRPASTSSTSSTSSTLDGRCAESTNSSPTAGPSSTAPLLQAAHAQQ